VAKYWPEFKAGGKEGVEVRHLLGHTAGLSGWTEPVTMEDTADWEKMTSLLAAQEPWWEPGTQSGYHALSQGYLVGEVVRRISGQTLGRFFKAELAEPLGADFHIGLGPEHDHRVANVIPPPPIDAAGLDPASIAVRTLTNPMLAAEASWNRWWKAAEIPAANGHGNARSVARVQSVLSCRGTVDGRTYLSEETCDKVFEQQASGTDLVLGVPMVLGVGYGINSAEMPLGPNPRTCFWGGWGGSLIVNDLDAQTTVAYMMNKMQSGLVGDERGIGIVFAALTAAGAA
jgi:CubicO group peptidase (beta-lactamase class C family)